MYLTNFYEEIAPLLAVVGEQPAFFRFLRDGQVTHAVRVVASLEIAEIGRREELLLLARLVFELLPHEDVLLVQGVPFAERLGQCCEQLRVLIVAVDVGRIFLHGVLDFQDGGIFAGLGVQHACAVGLFHGKIDVPEDPLAFAARAERIDRYGHAGTQGDEKKDDV